MDDITEKYYPTRWQSSMEHSMSINFAGCIASALMHKNLFKQVIFYEDLIDRPLEEMSKFFRNFNFREQDVRETLRGLEGHSQNFMFDKDAANSTKMFAKTLNSHVVDEVFQEMGLPISFNMEMMDYKKLFMP
jgi:hypothetical protein